MKDKKPLVIQKSNTLIDASFSLTLYESRVLLCCVAQIKPKKKADEMYFLDARRFSELFDLPIDGVYSKLRKAMNSLAERWVRISDENGHPKDIHWIITKQYFDSKGVVGLAFHPEMLPYISELQKHFTQYDIKNISRMRSNYGPMFYELISKRRDLNKQEFSLDFLRTKLRLEDKYCSWKDFKRNVIEPALRDLNAEQGEFKATYKPIKDGRAYVAVVIHYEPRQKSLPLLDSKGEPEDEESKRPNWEKFGYRTAGEYREALELAEKYDFNTEDPNQYLCMRTSVSRSATKK